MLTPFNFFLKPKLNILEKTSPVIPPVKKGGKVEEGLYLTKLAFNAKWQIMEERLGNTNLFLTVAFGALFICFITLLYGYWQFAITSYNDYSQRVKELSDQRYQFQQVEIELLLKVATVSGK